jgi:predicted ArsR family transcriptional regulator
MVKLQAENSGESVHYSALADALGVSTISAYNMLRVLEQKGCMRASYELSGLGVGRSAVLFDVTAAGRKLAEE